jgi:hypothetical protein
LRRMEELPFAPCALSVMATEFRPRRPHRTRNEPPSGSRRPTLRIEPSAHSLGPPAPRKQPDPPPDRPAFALAPASARAPPPTLFSGPRVRRAHTAAAGALPLSPSPSLPSPFLPDRFRLLVLAVAGLRVGAVMLKPREEEEVVRGARAPGYLPVCKLCCAFKREVCACAMGFRGKDRTASDGYAPAYGP